MKCKACREAFEKSLKDNPYGLLSIALEALIEMYEKIHPEIPEYEAGVKCLDAVPIAGKIGEVLQWDWEKKKVPKEQIENFGFLKHIRMMDHYKKKEL